MAVVPIKRKSGAVYYVDNIWQGKPVREKSGTSKRQAEIDDRAMKKAIKEGTYAPKTGMRATTVRQECDLFLQETEGPSKPIYAHRLQKHILSRPWLADMRASHVDNTHVDQLLKELRAEQKPDGSRKLNNQSLRNIVCALMAVFSRSVFHKRLSAQPIDIKAHKIEKSTTERQPYTKAEAVILMRHHAIRWPTRILNALILFTGMRAGEACGRKFRDLSEASPLYCLHVHDQYHGLPLKTKTPRKVPVHPELARILDEWVGEGFELYVGRKPTPDDYIVPCRRLDGTFRNYTKRGCYEAFRRGCKAAGVSAHTMHATRHTFVTLCRRADCNTEKLLVITHNPKKETIDQYTHRDWSELCEVVLKLNLDVHQESHFNGENPQILEGSNTMMSRAINENSHQLQGAYECRASVRLLSLFGKISQSENTPQDSRQEFGDYPGQLREANQRRKRRLRQLQRVDPTAVATGLFLAQALDCAYSDDRPGIESNLVKAEASLGMRS